MAFLIDAVIDDYEVRGVTTGTSKKGNTFKAIKLESKDGRSCEVSCTDDALFSFVDSLSKGDVITCKVRAVSAQKYSYISLLSAPVVKGNSYKGVDY